MAVEFKDDRYIITINTTTNPIEDWLSLHEELLFILRLLDTRTSSMDMPYFTLRLLEEMMPDYESALKLHPHKKKVG